MVVNRAYELLLGKESWICGSIDLLNYETSYHEYIEPVVL
jgi:hypothetical protein